MKAGIAGAGILGQLLAYSLLQAHWEVSLFDENNASSLENCSMAAAGLLSPTAELEKADNVIFEMGRVALQFHWPRIINQLGASIDFQQTGSLILAHPKDKLELQRYIQLIKHKSSNSLSYETLNQKQIMVLEPEVTQFQEGYFFPNEGFIDNQSLLTHLKNYLITQVQWHFDSFVQRIEPFKVMTLNQIHDFDFVFDCRGLGAKLMFNNLRAIRGELIWLHACEVNLTRPIRLLHPRYNLYVVPRSDQRYIVGASEIEAEDHSPISVRTALELLTGAYTIHRGFAEARIVKTLTHCRPTLTNHIPQIKYQEGFIAVNGLYRHGILLAPTLVDEIMSYLKRDLSAIHYPSLWERCI